MALLSTHWGLAQGLPTSKWHLLLWPTGVSGALSMSQALSQEEGRRGERTDRADVPEERRPEIHPGMTSQKSRYTWVSAMRTCGGGAEQGLLP